MVRFGYQSFDEARYLSLRYKISDSIPVLEPVQTISNVEAVIDQFENFCQISEFDDLVYKFFLFASILMREYFLYFLNLYNVERKSFDDLKYFYSTRIGKFVRNSGNPSLKRRKKTSQRTS